MPWEFDTGVDVSGAGTLAVGGQAVEVEVTFVPVGYGGDAIDTLHFHALGHVAWEVGSHIGQDVSVVWLSFIMADAPLGVTGLRYSFLPGVLATLRVGYWVPGVALGSSRLAPDVTSPLSAGWVELG